MRTFVEWTASQNPLRAHTGIGITGFLIVLLAITLSCTSASPPPKQGEISAPTVIQRIEPEFPPELQHLRGVVEIVGTIPREGGHMRDIRITRTEDSRLNQTVLDALSQWVWQPATLRGEPVDSEFRVQFKFPPG